MKKFLRVGLVVCLPMLAWTPVAIAQSAQETAIAPAAVYQPNGAR